MIAMSALGDGVKYRALAVFQAIAVGEARVHNVPIAEVHFHEVGALDSIVDIVGVAIGLDYLGVERVYSSVIPLGSGGLIRTQHGMMPLPAPATLEILKDYPVTLTDVPFELTTPTGAGIIKALSAGTLAAESLRAERVGFGAGTRDLPDRPNLVRVVIGEIDADPALAAGTETVTVIEATIDDMSPQAYPFVIERALEAGALDAFVTPVVMKKGRPGHTLTVLAPKSAVDPLARLILSETTTLGVRFYDARRSKLPREEVILDTRFGPVRMKRIGAGASARLVPEYEEARRIALEHRVPLLEVMEILRAAGRSASGAS